MPLPSHIVNPDVKPNTSVSSGPANPATAFALSTDSTSGAAAAVSSAVGLSPMQQVVNKLNALFLTLFNEKIIFGRANYIGDHPPKPVSFYVESYHYMRPYKTFISTHSWTNGKAIAALFSSVPNTNSVYVNHTGSFFFEITSSDNFKTLLETPDNVLKQKLMVLLAPPPNYKPAVRIQVPTPPALIQLVLVDLLSGEVLQCPVPSKTANNFSDWVANIQSSIKTAYGIVIDPKVITLLKFRLNGFITTGDPKNPLQNPQMAINANYPDCDLSQFTPKTVVTCRLPVELFEILKKTKPVNADPKPSSNYTVMVAGGPTVPSTAASNSGSAAAASIKVPGGPSITGTLSTTSSNAGSSGVTTVLSQLSFYAAPVAPVNHNASAAAAAAAAVSSPPPQVKPQNSNLKLTMYQTALQPIPIASSNDSNVSNVSASK